MSKSIVIAGYGPGISEAVARKFGAQGFAVALVGRTAERLASGASSLVDAGVTARPFVCDLSDAGAVRQLIRQVSGALGPIEVLHWNAYAPGAGDLTVAPLQELRGTLELGVVSAVAAVQEALSDLKKQKGAVLMTGGSLAHYQTSSDKMAAEWGAMGLAVTKAAQHKLVGVLHQKLASEGVYVGEVTVGGLVKGTAFDSGNATIDPKDVADLFWKLFSERKETYVDIS